MSTDIQYVYPSADARAEHMRAQPSAEGNLFAGGSPTFKDVLDAVNPLQQLPVVSTAYRAVTGDVISPISSLVGGFLFGGPIGLIAAAVNSGLEAATGHDLAGHALAMLTGSSETQVASAGNSTASHTAPGVTILG